MSYRWFPCIIENTGFSSERRFEIDLPLDGGKIVGVAYIDYFKDEAGQPLKDGVPPFGQSISGFVQCRVISQQEGVASVEFPGTDVVHVPEEAITAT